MQVRSLDQEDPLGWEMVTHSSSCPENSMDRGAWRATVYGAAKSQALLSDWALVPVYHATPYYRSKTQFSSLAQLCPTLCNPMNCSAPAFSEKGQIANILGFVSHVISVLTTQLSQCRASIPHGTKQATGSSLWSSTIMQEQAAAPHSSTLAWRIPGTGEPGGLLSMGSHRVGHDWSDLAAAAAL